MQTTRTIGQYAEDIAKKHLVKQGLKPICCNYYCLYGEIDLIMQDCADIVFVEVRLRSRLGFGRATETIQLQKKRRLIKSATHFLQRRNLLHRVSSRFDVVGIDLENHKIRIEWIKNAFLTT